MLLDIHTSETTEPGCDLVQAKLSSHESTDLLLQVPDKIPAIAVVDPAAVREVKSEWAAVNTRWRQDPGMRGASKGSEDRMREMKVNKRDIPIDAHESLS